VGIVGWCLDSRTVVLPNHVKVTSTAALFSPPGCEVGVMAGSYQNPVLQMDEIPTLVLPGHVMAISAANPRVTR